MQNGVDSEEDSFGCLDNDVQNIGGAVMVFGYLLYSFSCILSLVFILGILFWGCMLSGVFLLGIFIWQSFSIFHFFLSCMIGSGLGWGGEQDGPYVPGHCQ